MKDKEVSRNQKFKKKKNEKIGKKRVTKNNAYVKKPVLRM